MEINLKQELFIKGELNSSIINLEQKDLLDLKILGNYNNFKDVIIEKNTALHSPTILNKPFGAFVGAFSYMNHDGYIRDNVFIGRFCSIGRRVTIGAGMHHINGLSSSPIVKGNAYSQYSNEQKEYLNIVDKKWNPTIIENDVWIGDGVVIMPGIKIGTGAVIGANSVVTKDVLPYNIVGGVPAKPIKSRFPNEIIDRLLKSKWVELPIEIINSFPCRNIFEFLDSIEKHPFQEEVYHSYCVKK